jgi:hypothetical protein
MKEPLTVLDRTYMAVAGLVVVVVFIALAIVEALGGDARGIAATDGPWNPHLDAVDAALASRDGRAARGALAQAFVAALGSRRWEPMLAVGAAAVRVGDLSRARSAYLTAAFRARHARSVEGVLQAAEKFQQLGDGPVVERCLVLAREIASHDAAALARVRAFSEGVGDDAVPAGALQ